MEEQIESEDGLNGDANSISEFIRNFGNRKRELSQSGSDAAASNQGPAGVSSSSKRGRGGSHRISTGREATRQSSRVKQQNQQFNAHQNNPAMVIEFSQIPDTFNDVSDRLRQISSSMESLFSKHVPIAHQLLDRYAPVKQLLGEASSKESTQSSKISSALSSVSNETPIDNENNESQNNDDEKLEKIAKECLESAVASVSQCMTENEQQQEQVGDENGGLIEKNNAAMETSVVS